jgi:hypothetical protein
VPALVVWVEETGVWVEDAAAEDGDESDDDVADEVAACLAFNA